MNDFDPSKYVDREAAWEAFKRLWYAENPPLDNGYYICGICGDWVYGEDVTLDHIQGRDGELMFDPNNMQPAHGLCNYRKSSSYWEPVVTKETYEFLYFLSNI